MKTKTLKVKNRRNSLIPDLIKIKYLFVQLQKCFNMKFCSLDVNEKCFLPSVFKLRPEIIE